MNYRYRLYPDSAQEKTFVEWMEICRGAYNYALREMKDWCDSRKCLIDRCSLEREYILPAELSFPGEVAQVNNLPKAKKSFPRLGEVPSQVLQQAVKQLHRGWEYFLERGFGFPRFKKYGQFKSLLFPQFKKNPISDLHIKLPKIGAIPINLHRPIPSGFVVKQVRILRRADKWYASVNIQCDVSVPEPMPHGHPIGVDLGLEKFLATSDGVLIKPPKFFRKLQSELKLLQRRLSRKQKWFLIRDRAVLSHSLRRDWRIQTLFLSIVPGLIYFIFVHLRRKSQTLTVMPAVIVMAGLTVVWLGDRLQKHNRHAWVLLTTAIISLNGLFFLVGPQGLPTARDIGNFNTELTERIEFVQENFPAETTAILTRDYYSRIVSLYLRDYQEPQLADRLGDNPILVSPHVRTLVLLDDKVLNQPGQDAGFQKLVMPSGNTIRYRTWSPDRRLQLTKTSTTLVPNSE